MKELLYPFDSEYILRKKKSLKRQLLAARSDFIDKRIAILGGSTTSDIRDVLALFLLNVGIRPSFFESEYNRFWQDAMFGNPELDVFHPDLIYIHTSVRNITDVPRVADDAKRVDGLLKSEYDRFESVWRALSEKFKCPIIQNNFDYPAYRLLGNNDAVLTSGLVGFVSKLNALFAEYARRTPSFYISDLNYVSACYGLDRWHDVRAWSLFKYCCAIEAIPTLAFNVFRIVKAIFGKNKKAFVLDLDNTLWGGVVGDDGVEKLQIGEETAEAQAYLDFQRYLREHLQLGVILNVDSKNEEGNALAGLRHPDGALKPDDFIVIKANWEPKDRNLLQIAKELNLTPDSLLFVDDNPAEREIVAQGAKADAPDIGTVADYVRVLDRNGFFENVGLSADDLTRVKMYRDNAARTKAESSFANYGEYLKSLDMTAVICPFSRLYLERIAQLTNKSNQFNLTTKRFTLDQVTAEAQDADKLTLYGRLRDKFGDNGIVSLAIGRIEGDACHLELWLMSCRVLKRDMEFAMMDELVRRCRLRGVRKVFGYYYPTAKNGMVRDFYALQGFAKVSEDAEGNTVWLLDIGSGYGRKNKYIKVEEGEPT